MHGNGEGCCQAAQARQEGACPAARGERRRADQCPAAQAEKPSATAPSEEDLDFAYAALADTRGVVTAASLHAVASSLNFGWDEEDTGGMLQLFGAGRSLSRSEFAQVCAAVKARLPKRA